MKKPVVQMKKKDLSIELPEEEDQEQPVKTQEKPPEAVDEETVEDSAKVEEAMPLQNEAAAPKQEPLLNSEEPNPQPHAAAEVAAPEQAEPEAAADTITPAEAHQQQQQE